MVTVQAQPIGPDGIPDDEKDVGRAPTPDLVSSRRLLDGDMDCAGGAYALPHGPGLGVEPSQEALGLLRKH